MLELEWNQKSAAWTLHRLLSSLRSRPNRIDWPGNPDWLFLYPVGSALRATVHCIAILATSVPRPFSGFSGRDNTGVHCAIFRDGLSAANWTSQMKNG